MAKKLNFLGLDDSYCDFDKCRFAILPITYDRTASYLKGTAKAPEEIIAASSQLELFDEQLCDEFYQAGIYTHCCIGDNQQQPEQLFDTVYRTAVELLEKDKTILALGGEHSVSLGVIKAVNEKFSNLSLLQIDAHADLRDEYQGSKLSHACVMRRVFDMGIASVSAGIRSFDKAQHKFIKDNNLKIYYPWDIRNNPNWICEIKDILSENVYITVDIDGLDCAAVPGTGTPEPDGLKYHQVIDLITEIGRYKNIVAADIVETIPGIAGVTTEFTAARIAYKLITAMQL